MLMPRIIPCLDVRDGRVVKGVRFQNLRDAGDPAELARRYEDDGADELIFLDVSATLEGRIAMLRTIEAVRRQLSIPMTVGGGVRSVDDAAALLNSGADKISVNSAAVDRPQLVRDMNGRFGAQCTVVAIDAVADGDSWVVVTQSGTNRRQLDAIDWGRNTCELGAGEILLTSWDRDGTRSGYDLPLLRAASSAIDLPIIASGGANDVNDLRDALDAGAHAVLAASIFHDRDMTVRDVKHQLQQLGTEVRL